jgi:RimJ/RimL family protein N-acetyltransferase
MLEITTPLLTLTPLTAQHLQTLIEWRNSEDFLRYCTNRKNTVTMDGFKKELERDFRSDRHAQYIILRRSDQEPIGTIYSYNLNLSDGNVFVSTYLKRGSRSRLYGFEAVTAFCLWLFETHPEIYKLYMDVYEYNQISLSSLRKAGFKEEGRFKEHRLFENRRWDMFRLSFYRSQIETTNHLIGRVRPVK